MPVVMAPGLVVLFLAQLKARKTGILTVASSSYAHRTDSADRQSWPTLTKQFLIKIDALGLILLGVSWSLLFLPFTLKTSVSGGYENRTSSTLIFSSGVT